MFGSIHCERREVILYTVSDCSRKTLESVIRNPIAADSITVSSCWVAEKCINQIDDMNHFHQMINHSDPFVDTMTSAHTQAIESMWNLAKIRKNASIAHIIPYLRVTYVDSCGDVICNQMVMHLTAFCRKFFLSVHLYK